MNETFPTSRLTENLKLGSASGLARLRLSFTEDRALTALQLLLAQKSFDTLPCCPLTLEAQERWRWNDPVPVIAVPTLEFSKAYMQDGSISNEVSTLALKALQSLACKSFELNWPPGGVEYKVNSALIDVRQYVLPGKVQPKYLRIALSPPLFHGVYPEHNNFVAKQKSLFYNLDGAFGTGAGHRSEVPLRLSLGY